MPIYEYTCGACDHDFDLLVRSSSSEESPRCPKCESNGVVRKLSVFAARQGSSVTSAVSAGGCGRCGDPDGPCSM